MKSVIIFVLLAVSALSWVEIKQFSNSDIGADVGAIAFLNDNSGFIVGTNQGNLRSFSTSDPYAMISERSTGSNAILDIKVSPSGQSAVVCAGRSLHLISLPSLATTVNYTLPGNESCTDVQWDSNGQRVFVVGQGSGIPEYTTYNSTDLSLIQGYSTDFQQGSAIQDSSIRDNTLVLAGEAKGNATSSNVLLYDLSSNTLQSELPVSAELEAAQKQVHFSPNGNEIVVVGRGTGAVRVYSKNSNNEFVFNKDLVFGSNIADSMFLSDGTFVVLRQNGGSSLIQFVSLGDSSGSNIVVNQQVDTSLGTPGFLAVSPSGDYIASSFGSAGAKLFSSNRSSPIYPAVIGAVVGSVVVGSVAAVAIASAVAPVAGSIGATGGAQAGGIIGTQAVSSVPINAPINVDVGALQPDFKAIM